LENAFLYARHHLALSVVGLTVGLGLMLTFCLTTSLVVGVASFVVMFVSLDAFWTKNRRMIEGKPDDAAR